MYMVKVDLKEHGHGRQRQEAMNRADINLDDPLHLQVHLADW